MVNADSFVVHRPHIQAKASLAFGADITGLKEQLPSKVEGACYGTVDDKRGLLEYQAEWQSLE